MGDNKINMSLDDIIKKERANKSNTQGTSRRGFGNRRFGIRRNIRGGRFGGTRGARSAGRGAASVGRSQQPRPQQSVLNTAATMQMVNKLVKRAISRRANQNLIRHAASLQSERVVTRPRIGVCVP